MKCPNCENLENGAIIETDNDKCIKCNKDLSPEACHQRNNEWLEQNGYSPNEDLVESQK